MGKMVRLTLSNGTELEIDESRVECVFDLGDGKHVTLYLERPYGREHVLGTVEEVNRALGREVGP